MTEQLQRKIQKNIQAVFRCLTGHTPIRNLDPHRYADQVRRYAKSMYQSFVAGGYTQPISVQSCHIVPRLAGVPAAIQAAQAGAHARAQVDALVAAQAAQVDARAVQAVQAAQATQPGMQPSTQISPAPAQTPQPASPTLPHTFDICGRVHQGEDVFAFWALYTTTPAAEHLIMHSLRVILPPARI